MDLGPLPITTIKPKLDYRMRRASILLALVVVLGFVREAGAFSYTQTKHDYTVTVFGGRFGFEDGTSYWSGDGMTGNWSVIHLGPLGFRNSSFTATQGFAGCCLTVVGLVVLVTVSTVRLRKRAA
jgi:hypothetical protein